MLFVAQLTDTYRRGVLAEDEIHVVSMTLSGMSTATTASNDATADCESTLGIRLVGHRDANMRGVFICSLREASLADLTPGLQVSDEIVQVCGISRLVLFVVHTHSIFFVCLLHPPV